MQGEESVAPPFLQAPPQLAPPSPLQVLDERSQLHAAWQHKKVYLDQLIDLQFFLRDAKHLDGCSSTQEAALANAEDLTTIHQVHNLVSFTMLPPN